MAGRVTDFRLALLLHLAYRVVYDAAADGLWYWRELLALALVFPAVGVAACWRLVAALRRRGLMRGPDGVVRGILVALAGPALFGWPLYGAGQSYREYRAFQGRLARGEYTPVEGVVSDFTPGDPAGHGAERFRVGGRWYAYSEYELVPGYHVIRPHGGVLAPGLAVCLADIGGRIARVSVAAPQPPAAASTLTGGGLTKRCS